MESEHRRGERNRRQTGSMYTPAYRVLVSSEFTEGSFIPRQTGIVCASGQTTWTPECQVTVPCLARLCLSAAHTTTVGPHHPVTFKVLVSLFLRLRVKELELELELAGFGCGFSLVSAS